VPLQVGRKFEYFPPKIEWEHQLVSLVHKMDVSVLIGDDKITIVGQIMVVAFNFFERRTENIMFLSIYQIIIRVTSYLWPKNGDLTVVGYGRTAVLLNDIGEITVVGDLTIVGYGRTAVLLNDIGEITVVGVIKVVVFNTF